MTAVSSTFVLEQCKVVGHNKEIISGQDLYKYMPKYI